jgi:hypothetical protein
MLDPSTHQENEDREARFTGVFLFQIVCVNNWQPNKIFGTITSTETVATHSE